MNDFTTTFLLCLAGLIFGIIIIILAIRGRLRGEIYAGRRYINNIADRINNPIGFWISILSHIGVGLISIVMSLLYLLGLFL